MGISIDHNTVLNIADQAGGITVRPDYSGRYMYGSSCLAVVGSVSEFASFLITAAEEAAEYHVLKDFARELQDPSSDSMGLSTVWYWPRIQVTNIVETEDEEDEDEDDGPWV